MTVFVSRDEWGARPREKGTTDIIASPSVTFHYEGDGVSYPWDHSKCAGMVRSIQAYHMDGRDWSDIAYNELACPHDYVFEGRGYDRRSSANGEDAYNNASFAVCALWGANSGNTLPDGLKRAMLYARKILMDKGGATKTVLPHSYWHSTSCPGDLIRAWIKAGIPSPDPVIIPSKDFDLATIADLRAAIKEECKDGGSIHELVQSYAAFGAKHSDQLVDDTGAYAGKVVDVLLKDDFQNVVTKVDGLETNIQKIVTALKIT